MAQVAKGWSGEGAGFGREKSEFGMEKGECRIEKGEWDSNRKGEGCRVDDPTYATAHVQCHIVALSNGFGGKS